MQYYYYLYIISLETLLQHSYPKEKLYFKLKQVSVEKKPFIAKDI